MVKRMLKVNGFATGVYGNEQGGMDWRYEVTPFLQRYTGHGK